VVYRRGLPFEACVPNEETLSALNEIQAGGGQIIASSTDEVFDSILEVTQSELKKPLRITGHHKRIYKGFQAEDIGSKTSSA
jgi:hypothetical protein